MKDTVILALESSCDETACALVRNGNEILSSKVASQIDVHTLYGGVVPEVASRIHIENISIIIKEALEEAKMGVEDVDAIAVTVGPGLIGSLHVGVLAAKTLALAYHKPLVPVQHLTGHIYANAFVDKLQFPLLALVVSGGHTELVLMKEDYDFEVIGTSFSASKASPYITKVFITLARVSPCSPSRIACCSFVNNILSSPYKCYPLLSAFFI